MASGVVSGRAACRQPLFFCGELMSSVFSARRFLLATSFLALSSPVLADPNAAPSASRDPNAITNIVISPTRTAVAASKTASSVTVITRADIEKKQKPDVVELLRDVPGLAVAGTGSVGQTGRVFMRGAESRHTLVLIDGVAANDPSDPAAAFDFSNLTTDNIERIEILRGAQSTLYGSDAIGGVIHITTRRGVGKPRHFASLEGGSYDTYKLAVGSDGMVGKVGYSLSASQFDTSGFSAFSEKSGGRETDGSSARTVALSLDRQFTDNFSLLGNFRYNRNYAYYDDFGADSANENHANQFNGRVAGKLSLLDDRWTHEIGLGSLLINRTDFNTFGNTRYRGVRNKLDWLQSYQIAQGHLTTLGLESSDDIFKTESIVERSVRTNSAFLQHQIDLWDSFYISIGGRYDDNEQFGSNTTYRIAPAYRIKETNTKLKASVGTGYKAPSLFQLYSVFGNTALSPEESKGYEAGVEQSLVDGRLKLESVYFKNSFSSLIDYNFATNKYYNAGRAETRGVENVVRFGITPELSLSANYTFLITEDSQKRELVRRPKHRGGVALDYASGDWAWSVGTRSVGDRNDINLAFARDINPSYTIVNMQGRYRVNEMASLTGRIENLFNREYEEVMGYGSPGFSAYTGVKVDF